MSKQRVTAEQIARALESDFEVLAEEIAEAMNSAKAGSIIDDSELGVFEANGKFRREAFTKALKLVQDKHESFSPWLEKTAEPGQTKDKPRND